MKLRHVAIVGLAPIVGCGDPGTPAPVDPSKLDWSDKKAQDSARGPAWKNYLEPARLNGAWAPSSTSPWLAYHKSSLIAAISIVKPTAGPVYSQAETQTEKEAEAFASKVDLANCAVFVDLTGPESVSWGAVLARHGAVPVCTFNNWPHQNGLIKHERTLGALLYYADEMSRAPREGTVPVFMLEVARLGRKDYSPPPDVFDNRYFHLYTDFPTFHQFLAKNITTVYYVSRVANFEEDDLNDYFVGLKTSGMQFFIVKPSVLLEPNVSRDSAIFAMNIADRQTIFDKTTASQYTSRQPGGAAYYRHYSYYHSYWYYSHSTYGGYGGGSGSGGGGWGGGSSG